MYNSTAMDKFYWDDPFPIALALIEQHPNVDLTTVDWDTLHKWVTSLPQFADDKSIASVYLLEDILKEWYEEISAR